MANSKITWANKESLVTDPTIAEINKVTDSNMNEIKNVVNENADQVILSDTEPTENDNELWIDTSSNATYMNQEVNIGATNPNNTPTWFKQGKNLMGSPLELGTYSDVGLKSASTANYRNVTPIAVQPNTTYTFSINGVSQKYAVYYYDSLMTFISAEGLTTGTFTTPANCYYINFRCFNADYTSDFANLKLQLELGSSATSYEAYITPEIIIDNNEIYSKPDEIFSNNTGVTLDLTNNRTFNLAKNSLDYKYIEIVYSVGNIMASTGKIPCINQGQILFNVLFLATTDTIQQRTLVVRNDGTSLYLVRASYINAQVGGGFSVNTNSGSCSIHRVILYK